MSEKPIWERLREIADQAERASQAALSEEADRRLQEYRTACLDDPIEITVRCIRPTAWQVQALRIILACANDADERGGAWYQFLRATKPEYYRSGVTDDEMEGLAAFTKSTGLAKYGLNPLGLALLTEIDDREAAGAEPLIPQANMLRKRFAPIAEGMVEAAVAVAEGQTRCFHGTLRSQCRFCRDTAPPR